MNKKLFQDVETLNKLQSQYEFTLVYPKHLRKYFSTQIAFFDGWKETTQHKVYRFTEIEKENLLQDISILPVLMKRKEG